MSLNPDFNKITPNDYKKDSFSKAKFILFWLQSENSRNNLFLWNLAMPQLLSRFSSILWRNAHCNVEVCALNLHCEFWFPDRADFKNTF